MRVLALFKAAIAASVLSIMAASPALAQVGLMGGLNLGTVSVSELVCTPPLSLSRLVMSLIE